MIFRIITLTFAIFTLATVSFADVAHQCKYTGHSHILIANKVNDKSIRPKNSNCPEIVNQKMSQFLFENKGVVKANYLNEIFKREFNEIGISISPTKIEVGDLKSFINNEAKLNQGFRLTNIKINQKINVLYLDNNRYKVECHNCLEPGKKSLYLNIYSRKDPNTIRNRYMFQATLQVKTNGLVSKKGIQTSGYPLNKNLFTPGNIYTEHPEQVVNDIDTLKFHRLNKNIAKGSLLLKRDLVPIYLVKTGLPARVVYKNSNMILEGMALPTQSGRLNQTIVLRHPNTNKRIVGKVIDFNKVLVSL